MMERMNRSPACCQRHGTRPARLAPLVWVVMLALGYLAACDTSTTGEGTDLPTATATVVEVAEETPRPTRAPGLSPSPTPEREGESNRTEPISPTETPTVAPAATEVVSSPTALPADQAQEATTAPTALPQVPVISEFTVTPEEVDPGGSVTLAWEASGDRATICPTARYVLFTPDDCLSVSPTGTTTFAVPADVGGNHLITFALRVETSGISDAAEWQVSVALPCELRWFFDDEALAGHCPTQPVSSFAAAQRFERGTMIWLERPGRYYILDESTPYGDGLRRGLQIISDPLEIVGDSSGDVRPPDGLYAPQSGFGLVWRGDVTGSPGFREVLGWALAPEFGYDAILQCDDAPPSGGRSWQTCYLLGPAGEVIVFHPLGGWYLLD